MKFALKKIFKMFCLCLLITSMTFTPVFAAAAGSPALSKADTAYNQGIRLISPEEMEQLITAHEKGIDTYNWFPDYVLATVTNEGSYCKVVFMNVGFPFDRCDITGTVTLYNMSSTVVANKKIAEYKLIYGVARVVNIYPTGGKYVTGSYSLRISDGDIGTLYTGLF